jgi:hypothetical protein
VCFTIIDTIKMEATVVSHGSIASASVWGIMDNDNGSCVLFIMNY